jgi:hypothetical protein
MAFAQLRQRIAEESQADLVQARRRPRYQPLRLGALRSLYNLLQPGRAAIALSLVVAIGLVYQLTKQPTTEKHTPSYRTLADSVAWRSAREDEISVVFADGVEPEEIKQLLRKLRVDVVDGPNAVGVYTLRLAADVSDRNDLALIEQLRRHPSTAFVEPALPPAANRGQSSNLP